MAEPPAATPPVSTPSRLLGDLIDRHGFALSPAPEASGLFHPASPGVAGELSGLPARVDEGSHADGSTRLVRVRLGVIDGDPAAAAQALAEVPSWSVSPRSTGLEIIATLEQIGGEPAAVSSYTEDVAKRCAAAIELQGSTRPQGTARIFNVAGFPQWVTTPDVADVEGLELRHLEPSEGLVQWDEMAVVLAATADGAMTAIGGWDQEVPMISIMGRIALLRQTEDGRESPIAFGSGICVFTNGRLLGVVYARPDDDVLEALGKSVNEAGITFTDGSGRAVNPLLSMPEEEKALQFIDEAGVVDEAGGGVVLAFSALAEVFERLDLEGGMVQRGLGIPPVHLSGGTVDLRIVPFRVLDQESHTVKPRRGQIRESIEAWWGLLGSEKQPEEEERWS